MGFGSSGSGGGAISGASDVALSNPANNQGFQYNTSSLKWQNGPVPSQLQENINVVSASGATETLPDVTTATLHDVTLSANCTFTFPTATAGKSFTLRINYTSTSFGVTWPSNVDWPSDITPTLTQVAGRRDIFSFVCFTNGAWTGFTAGLNYPS